MTGRTALALAGPLAVAAAWVAVRRGALSVWSATAAAILPAAAAALVLADVRAARAIGLWPAVGAGGAAGALLYAATAGFVRVARGWAPLQEQARALYAAPRPGPGPVGVAWAGLVAAGEEILWRGAVQPVAVAALGPLGGVALAWGAYVGANAVGGNLPVLLGAAVGGAAWAALAAWSGGVAASVACHVAWTALMVAAPPVRAAPP